jgi:biotin synthase
MIGIGPFIPHHDTRFAAEPPGSLELTLYLLSLLRLMLPGVLLPATTALGSIQPDGRELGVLAGANVIMPNLSPPDVRGKYLLYDNKLNTGAEAAEGLLELRRRLAAIDCEIAVSRGDFSEVSTNK